MISLQDQIYKSHFRDDPTLENSTPNGKTKNCVDTFSKEDAKSFVKSTIQRATRSLSPENKRMRSVRAAWKKHQSARPGSSARARKVPSNHWFAAAREELTNITTLNLITSSGSMLEKILWAMVAIGGTIFIYNVVDLQLDNWRDNPALVTKVTRKLADMPLPAVTFCPKAMQKYGLVERLGNYIDPEKKVPKEVVAIRNEFLKVHFQKMKDHINGKNFCKWLFGLFLAEEKDNLILSQIPNNERDTMEAQCIVSSWIEISSNNFK